MSSKQTYQKKKFNEIMTLGKKKIVTCALHVRLVYYKEVVMLSNCEKIGGKYFT